MHSPDRLHLIASIAALTVLGSIGVSMADGVPGLPPPPAIPGYPEPAEREGPPELPPLTPEELAARQAEADASPRRNTFGDHRPRMGPAVPPAPTRRRQQIRLIPSEAMVADRGALSESLRVQAADLRLPSGFSTVYEVEQRPDVLVRGDGAIYAVFPQGDYALAMRDKRPVVQTLVPAGTMFYIGEPDWRRVWLPGLRGMMPRLALVSPEEQQAKTPPASAVHRVEPTMPHDYEAVYIMPMMMEDFPGIGLLSTRIDTWVTPASRAFGTVSPSGIAQSHETVRHPLLTGSLAPFGEGDSDEVAPPLHLNDLYRRDRISGLLQRAAQVGADQPAAATP